MQGFARAKTWVRAAALACAAAAAGCASTTLAPGQSFPVFFTTGTAAPDATGQTVVDRAAGWARQYPAERVTVTGYADVDQPAASVAHLALRRAQTIAHMLRLDGVDKARIVVRLGHPRDTSSLYDRRVDIGFSPI